MEETNTIKGKEVIAYKGMKSDMTCRDFKYEVGKTYKTDKAELCQCGFHACLNPLDVLEYYSQDECSRYFKVKLSGEITKCDISDTKLAATEITILEEITIDEIIIINNTEWWKNENVLDLLYYSDGFSVVKNEDYGYNFIDKQGKFLSEKWFEKAFEFHEGLARVQRSDKQCNYINKKGKIISDEWFNWADNSRDGFARVQRTNGDWNFINKKGKIISDEWFNYLDDFNDGFARVERTNGEFCKINKTGKIVGLSK